MSGIAPTAPRETRADRDHDGRLLADAMSVNAIFAGTCGLTLLAGAWALADLSGVDAGLLAALGVVLVAFAAGLLWLLGAPRMSRSGARAVVAADVAWVVGAVVILVARPGAVSAAGAIALGIATAVVAAVAVAQWLGLRRIGSGPVVCAAPVTISAARVVDGDPDHVWDVLADVGDYARFADGIIETEIVAGHGEGMVRVCTDNRGGRWRETCTLWEEGRRYRMRVDVATYPWRYRVVLSALTMTCEVGPVAGGTRVSLRFDGAAKLGVVGRLAVRALAGDGRVERILDAYEHHIAATPGDGTGFSPSGAVGRVGTGIP